MLYVLCFFGFFTACITLIANWGYKYSYYIVVSIYRNHPPNLEVEIHTQLLFPPK